jgi:hypothetical protein
MVFIILSVSIVFGCKQQVIHRPTPKRFGGRSPDFILVSIFPAIENSVNPPFLPAKRQIQVRPQANPAPSVSKAG